MAETNQNMQGTGSQPLPDIPPVGGSSGGLAPGQTLQPRKVSNATPLVAVTEKDFNPQGELIGQQLVNKDGVPERLQYSEDEAYAELAKFKSVTERKQFLNTLYSVGVYGKQKPSDTGFAPRDITAMQQALRWANWKGRTVDVAAPMMLAEIGPIQQPGTRVRTTPKQDLQSIFSKTASSILGRQLSQKEIDKFVKAYNQQEVSEAQGGAFTPSASVAAEQAVMAAAPEEADAMGALTLTNIFDSMIKGLG